MVITMQCKYNKRILFLLPILWIFLLLSYVTPEIAGVKIEYTDNNWYSNNCQGDDGFEDNDSPDTAILIAVPFNQNNLKICDNDYYRVYVNQSRFLVATAYVPPNGDITLYLLIRDNGSQWQIYRQDNSNEDQELTVIYDVGDTREIVIGIVSFGDPSGDTYQFELSWQDGVNLESMPEYQVPGYSLSILGYTSIAILGILYVVTLRKKSNSID
jgi:hypothetical protein